MIDQIALYVANLLHLSVPVLSVISMVLLFISEVLGISPLKSNSIVQLVKNVLLSIGNALKPKG